MGIIVQSCFTRQSTSLGIISSLIGIGSVSGEKSTC
jgi:hypothetical protein